MSSEITNPQPRPENIKPQPSTETQHLIQKNRTNTLGLLSSCFTDPEGTPAIWKDVIVIGIAYLIFRLCYLSYIFNLGELFPPNLAYITLATSFGGETLTSLFLPTLIIRKFGCKLTMMLVAATTVLFGIAEFFPSYYIFIPCGIILGAGYSCLWVALATYLTNVGRMYIKLQPITMEAILGRFFGTVSFLGAIGGVLGNVISFAIFGSTEQKIDSVYFSANRTLTCGAQYCHHMDPEVVLNSSLLQSEIFTEQLHESRTFLFLAYIFIGLIGPLCICFFLDKRQHLEESMRKTDISALQQIGATIMALKNVNLLLLSVSCFLAGITFSFASGNFSQAYVDCAIGSEYVAIVAIVHLIAYSAASFGCGFILKYVSILGVFLFINISTEVVYIFMLLWQPTSDGLFIASAFSGWLGVFVAAHTNLLNTLCGIILHGNREATFAFFRLFYSLGSTVGFAGTNHTCVWIMIIIFMALIAVGTFMYLITEYRIRQERKCNMQS